MSLVLLVCGGNAWALDLRLRDESLRLDVSETLIYAYHLDNKNGTYADDRYHEVQSRLNLGLVYGRWRLALRVDTGLYFNHASCDEAGNCTHPSPPPEDEVGFWPPLSPGELKHRYENRTLDRLGSLPMPERLSVGYTGRTLEVTLGDHYVSFGRGLVLSLRKVDELGSDTTLRGGRIVVRGGRATGTLVAGVTNIVNVDEATGRVSPDPLDVIVGVRTEASPKANLTFAVHGVTILDHRSMLPGQPEKDKSILAGASLEGRKVPLLGQAYVEYAHAEQTFVGSDASGDAVYAAVTRPLGALTLLFEGKFYRRFPMLKPSLESPSDSFATIRYNNPPTVERILADMESGDVLDVGGGRFKADHRLGEHVSSYVSYGYFYDFTDKGALLDIHDPYAGVRVSWQDHRSHATLSGGARVAWERKNTDEEFPLHDAGIHSLDGHVELEMSQALSSRLSVELIGRHRYRNKRVIGKVNKWHEGEWALGLRFSPYMVVAGGWEYTSDPAKPHPPCGEVGEPVCETYDNMHFFNGQVSWTFRGGSTVRIFAGGQRGGLRCVSGVCRVFPSFQGIKAEAVVRF